MRNRENCYIMTESVIRRNLREKSHEWFRKPACLLLFGSGNFLIPAMLVIALLLCIRREESGDE